MRTALIIDDDVLDDARRLAKLQETSVGKMISVLARCSLQSNGHQIHFRNGVPLLPVHRVIVTPKIIKQLDNELI